MKKVRLCNMWLLKKEKDVVAASGVIDMEILVLR